MIFMKCYRGRRVLITGHTGFKGAWLALLMRVLGAEVLGYSRDIPTNPSLFTLITPSLPTVWGDLRERERLAQTIEQFVPEIIFHLAAQPFVQESYRNPWETIETNVMGTVALLESVRTLPPPLRHQVRAVVVVTSDKCYHNLGVAGHLYQEADPLGGEDPYSASKAACELLVESYRTSFFPLEEYGKSHSTLLATARAGNIIGGGDWGKYRLIPDLMRAIYQQESMRIRYPTATRPWQHIFDALWGYQLLARALWLGHTWAASSWNFGPSGDLNSASSTPSVQDVVQAAYQFFPNSSKWQSRVALDDGHFGREQLYLQINPEKARQQLGWQCQIPWARTLEQTFSWYRTYYEKGPIDLEGELEEWLRSIGPIPELR